MLESEIKASTSGKGFLRNKDTAQPFCQIIAAVYSTG